MNFIIRFNDEKIAISDSGVGIGIGPVIEDKCYVLDDNQLEKVFKDFEITNVCYMDEIEFIYLDNYGQYKTFNIRILDKKLKNKFEERYDIKLDNELSQEVLDKIFEKLNEFSEDVYLDIITNEAVSTYEEDGYDFKILKQIKNLCDKYNQGVSYE